MGSQVPELNNNTIHTDTFRKNLMSFCPLYIAEKDTLVFQPEKSVPAISVGIEGGDLMLRIDPKTKEIVGIEIEDFQGYFVAKYPAFAPIWKQMKTAIRKNKCENETLTTFLTIVQELLGDLVTKQGSIRLSPSLIGQPTLL